MKSNPNLRSIGAIGIVGVGVIGEALVSALISAGVEPSQINATVRREEHGRVLFEKYGVRAKSLSENLAASDIVLLAVKPKDMESVLDHMKGLLRPETLVISFAAGKKIRFVSEHLGGHDLVIRVMPNTPTMVGAGMAAMSAGPKVIAEQVELVHELLAATGKVVDIEEELQDAATSVSGSGPAYFFSFIEAMVEAGVDLGLSREIASELAIQTMIGAAKLLESTGKTPTILRENVTSPNGTTAAALRSFAESDLSGIVKKAMTAARDRSREMA